MRTGIEMALPSQSPNVSFTLIQFIIRLQVAVVTNFINMLMRNIFVNVFLSDPVIWWAAIFRTTSSMFDKLLHLSKSKSFALRCSRICNFCEAVLNLLTVTMYLQDTLSRFHRPGLHKRNSCPRGECVDLHPCVSLIPELLSCLSVHSTIIPGEHLLHWSLAAMFSQAPPTSAIS